MYFDAHCHLADYKPEEIEKVIKNAERNGVFAIISNGTDPKANRKNLELAKKYSIVKVALGLYPTKVLELSDEEINKELDFIRKNKDKIIAIGEIGLDYKAVAGESDRKRVEKIFRKFLDLAEELKLPAIVHSRKAEKRILEVIRDSKAKIVLHCYMGKSSTAKKAIAVGKYYFTIPPKVERNEYFQSLVRKVPLNKILAETDAPYTRKSPAEIKDIVKKIAEIKEIPEEKVAKQLVKNYKAIFRK